MKSSEKTFKLKKPVVVWIIGCCFIFAPPANMAAALLVGKVADWYVPARWLDLFNQQVLTQQILLALFPVAGVSLLIQRKTSWLFAVVLLLGGCVQNLYSYFTAENLAFPVAGPLIVNGAVFVVFYYFRYPYLDKRDQIFRGLSNRYLVAMPVSIESFEGVSTENISDTGCYLRFSKSTPLPAVDSVIQIHFDGTAVDCVVLRHDGNGCAVRFQERLSRSKIRDIRERFSKQSKAA